MKVAFIGTHGVGKTTLAYGLAMRLKQLGANVGFLEEVARRCPFPINEETSLQAQVLIPLVTSLMFGLLSSTVMVLFVIPSFYLILDDLKLTAAHRADAGKGHAHREAEAGAISKPASEQPAT